MKTFPEQLSACLIDVASIYLDPNNPRFWTGAHHGHVPDKRITNPAVQKRTRAEIDNHNHGIDSLYESILYNGFLPLDRIVVRELEGQSGKFVVVEGNRRLRSLSRLRQDITEGRSFDAAIPLESLEQLVARTNTIEVLVYRGNDGDDISWIFQGIRHINGVRDWDPAQRAKLIADQIDRFGQSIAQTGQQFGLSASIVGRLYRTYRALAQMAADEDYGRKARNDYFSLFEAVHRTSSLRDWLGWSEQSRCFTDVENCKRFYSWITPDDENGCRRRIHAPSQIKDVGYLVENQHWSLLTQIDSHELTIEQARSEATMNVPKPRDWRKAMAAATAMLGELPQSAMSDDPEEFLSALHKLLEVLIERKKMVEVALSRG